jgi:hypothetical protein
MIVLNILLYNLNLIVQAQFEVTSDFLVFLLPLAKGIR